MAVPALAGPASAKPRCTASTAFDLYAIPSGYENDTKDVFLRGVPRGARNVTLRFVHAHSGTPVKIRLRSSQAAYRHSTHELTGRYTRPRAVDIEAATSKLPSLRPGTDQTEPQAVAMTGTDPGPVFKDATSEMANRRNFNTGDGTRTHDLRIMRPRPEDCQALENKPKASNQRSLAPSCIPDNSKTDADLAEIVHAWDELPEAIRAAMLAMVRATARGGESA